MREIWTRGGILLISDDTICGWGRLGTWFGAQRFDLVPDVITTAKGLTSAYVPMGAVIASERVAAPFLAPGAQFAHGLTFGGHPVAAAVALANLDVLEGEDLLGRIRPGTSPRCAPASTRCGRSRWSATYAARATSGGSSWSPSRPRAAGSGPRRRTRSAQTSSRPELRRRGLICRATDRGYPVIQLAPPLIAGPEQFDEIGAVLHDVLTLACERMGMG